MPPTRGPGWYSILALLGETELSELESELHRSQARGYRDENRLVDRAFKALVDEMERRIDERRALPETLQPLLLYGRDGNCPWTIETEIESARRCLTLEFICCGHNADLSDPSPDELAELTHLRIDPPGAFTVGFSLRQLDREKAEMLCSRIGVDLMPLPGIAEELAGKPASHDVLYERWKESSRRSSTATRH